MCLLPYSALSAAHQATHFKDFQSYYFDNCIYEQLYSDTRLHRRVSTSTLLHILDADYKIFPMYELTLDGLERGIQHLVCRRG